jgi:Kef-type K+ transport system membrane component KefB
MISRGEVGLIVADVGVNNGLLLENEFSAVVVMVLVTTVITPPILRALFAKPDIRREKATDKARRPDSADTHEEAE